MRSEKVLLKGFRTGVRLPSSPLGKLPGLRSGSFSVLRKTKKYGPVKTGPYKCGRRDLNPYPLPDTPLKRARMPIPPRPRRNIEIIRLRFSFVKLKGKNLIRETEGSNIILINERKQERMGRKARIRYFLPVILMIMTVLLMSDASSSESFTVKRVGNIHPYADNAFQISAPEAGSLEIRIHDSICTYRVLSQNIQSGETTIHWDGCGYNREKLYEKTYTITAELTAESGTNYSVSYDSPVEYPAQCLQYALPSSDTLYLDDPESWFIEYRTVTKGTIIIEIISSKDPDEKYSYSLNAAGGKIARKTFHDFARKKKIPQAGDYILSVYEQSKPDEKYENDLYIRDSAPLQDPITVTGEIMPDRNMSDGEIWELMMKPSVVIDIDSFKHQDVYSEPDSSSKSLGTLHGQTQGLKILGIDDGWALIGAWNHEEAAYVEGWVPLNKLKTEAPRGEYGLLIDKQKQTLTVYRNGRVIDTLLVSTGRAEKNCLFQETAAGCFLTGYHRVNFSMNGKKYDYVIQYDGGNLLHQTPYDWGQQKKDFTLGRGYLGAKASHACIRIQPEPGNGGLNAYWLFTHLPYHTRVIILDDPWEHESAAEKLKRSDKAEVDLSLLHPAEDLLPGNEHQVIITFGGSVLPGGTRSFNSRKESFSVFAEQKGYELAFSGVKQIFSADDITCISLGCMIQKDPSVFPEEKGTLFAAAGTEQILEDASVELVQMTGESINSSDGKLYTDSAVILQKYTDVLQSGRFMIYRLKGHVIGFTACTEKEYLKNPDIIDRKTEELKNAGCEKIIMLFDWSDGHTTDHSIVQEAMAHRSVRAGADLVIGNCKGIVQGVDMVEGIPVIYSTGDLLNGSTSIKPRNQQGILVRAVFSFESGRDTTSVTIIPVMPYGGSDSKENEYMPTCDLTSEQMRKAVGNIWKDSTDAALETYHVMFSNHK